MQGHKLGDVTVKSMAKTDKRYDVLLVDVIPSKRVAVIGAMMKNKLPRQLTLQEAMMLVFRLPSTLIKQVSYETAMTMELIFEVYGATVTIRPSED